MHGPLKPQWVIIKGALSIILDPATLTCTSGTETPISLVIGLPGKLKVNKDGTGSSIVCPRLISQSNMEDFGEPPQAMQRKSAVRCWESAVRISKMPFDFSTPS